MSLNSIRARMTAAFLLSIAALMLAVCGGWIGYARYAAERNAAALLDAKARALRAEFGGGRRFDVAEWTEEEQDLRADNLALMVLDGRGRILQKSPGRVPEWPRAGENGWRVAVVSLGDKTIVVGLPWVKTDLALQQQARLLVGISLLVVAAAALGAWLLVGRTLSPIGRLSRQAQAASADSLRLHLDAPSQDAEVMELVTTLNDLLARLGETAAAKGRFYAAASHELRTPLQALSGHLELALSRSRSQEEYRAIVQESHAQTRRLISLIGGLLLLNRLDSLPSRPVQEPVPLPDICTGALCHFAPLIEERNLCVQTLLPPEAEVPAASGHAEMLVRNLVENAVKYAARGGLVRVQVTSQHGETRMEIFDECPPLPEWDERKLFEPFYRPDASRNSETGGNGLGLAICKAIADANGWNIGLQPNDRGICAIVRFGSGTD